MTKVIKQKGDKMKKIKYVELCQCGYDSRITVTFWGGSSRIYPYEGGTGGWNAFIKKYEKLAKANYIY